MAGSKYHLQYFKLKARDEKECVETSVLGVSVAGTLEVGALAAGLACNYSKKVGWNLAKKTVKAGKQVAKKGAQKAAETSAGSSAAVVAMYAAAGLVLMGGVVGYQAHKAGNEIDASLKEVKRGLREWQRELRGDTSRLAREFKKCSDGHLSAFATALKLCRKSLKDNQEDLKQLVQEIEQAIAKDLSESEMDERFFNFKRRLERTHARINNDLKEQARVGQDLEAVLSKLEARASAVRNQSWVQRMCGGLSLAIVGAVALGCVGSIGVCPITLTVIGVGALFVLGHNYVLSQENNRRDLELAETKREVRATMRQFREKIVTQEAECQKILKMMDDARAAAKEF